MARCWSSFSALRHIAINRREIWCWTLFYLLLLKNFNLNQVMWVYEITISFRTNGTPVHQTVTWTWLETRVWLWRQEHPLAEWFLWSNGCVQLVDRCKVWHIKDLGKCKSHGYCTPIMVEYSSPIHAVIMLQGGCRHELMQRSTKVNSTFSNRDALTVAVQEKRHRQ